MKFLKNVVYLKNIFISASLGRLFIYTMRKSISSARLKILNKQITKEIISGFSFRMVKFNIQKLKEPLKYAINLNILLL